MEKGEKMVFATKRIVGANSPSKLDIFSSYLVLYIAMYSYFN
jgi:hypothetical protein